MTRPWLSVVVPVFNGEPYLGTALESIAAQADETIECVVVDDGSTDRSLEVARSFVPRLRMDVIAGLPRNNWVAATNRGLKRARGTFVSFLHQDDFWRPGRLGVLRALATRYPYASMVFHAARFVAADGTDLGGWRPPFRSHSVLSPAELVERLLVQNFICIGAPMFRRDLLHDGLDETLWYTADWDLWLRVASTGQSVYTPEALVGFRVHARSQTVQRSVASSDFGHQLSSVLDRHLATWSAPSPVKRRVAALAIASNIVNVALASLSHGDRSRIAPALHAVVRLGPAGCLRLFKDTRLSERVTARLRARLHQ